MNPLTADEARALSQVDYDARGLGEATPDPLQPYVDEANAYVESVTGRVFASMPTALEAIASKAVAMRVEQMAISGDEGTVETAADFDLIGSFSAGSYSETRRDPAAGKSAGAGFPEINPWPALNRQLWMLLDTTTYPDDAVDAKSDWYFSLLRGMNRPAWEVVEVDWARGNGMQDIGVPRQSFSDGWPTY